MAAMGSARADVLSIDPDECSAGCLSPAADGEGRLAGKVTLSRLGGGAGGGNDARPNLILDPKALPPVLVAGLPSAIAALAADTPDSEGVSPYAVFAEVIDIPRSADARAVPFFLSAPSFASRLSEFLWASNDFFGPRSEDITARRSLPLSADADALYGGLYGGPRMQARVTPTPSASPASGAPSAAAANPFGQAGDQADGSAGLSTDGAESNQ